jgi:vacuolar protein sorting-associated protein 54
LVSYNLWKGYKHKTCCSWNSSRAHRKSSSVHILHLSHSSLYRHPLAEGIDLPSIQDELSHILVSFAELSNASAAKLITVRSDQHASASLPLASFVQIFDASTSFVVRCEVACRRMIVGLRGAIVSQAKAFLQAFHQERLSRAAKMVEDELWNPVDVPHEVQWAVDMLVECAMRDPVELMSKPAAANGLEASPNSDATKTTNGTNGDEEKTADAAPSKHLKIEDRSYFVVGATLQTLLLLSDYARLVLALDTLTTDTMARCIEFLKAFNSRTCQVVLGAGAMRSAGLKNITAKHLALASQSLSVVITLVPYVREMFRRHLSAKQAVMLVEFDKLKRVSPSEHQIWDDD